MPPQGKTDSQLREVCVGLPRGKTRLRWQGVCVETPRGKLAAGHSLQWAALVVERAVAVVRSQSLEACAEPPREKTDSQLREACAETPRGSVLFEIVLLPFAHLRQAVGPKWGSSAVMHFVVASEVVLESATVESVQVTIVASEGEMVDVA